MPRWSSWITNTIRVGRWWVRISFSFTILCSGPCSSWVRLSLSPLSTVVRLRPARLPRKGRISWSTVSARKCRVAASTFKEDRELTSPGPLSRASYRLVVWRYELDITRQKWPGPKSTPRWTMGRCILPRVEHLSNDGYCMNHHHHLGINSFSESTWPIPPYR